MLKGYGKRQHKQAVEKAKTEWVEYQRRLDAEVNAKDMAQIEREVKALRRGEGLSDKMCAFSAKDSRHCLGIRRDNAQ